MSLIASNPTPLFTAFGARVARHRNADVKVPGRWFESFLTVLGCMIPVAVCLYLVDVEPLFKVGDVEFTQPDVVAVVLVVAVTIRAMFKGFHRVQKSFFLPVALFLFSTIVSALNASDSIRAAAAVVQIIEFGLVAWCFSLVTSAKKFLTIIYAIFAVFIFETVVATFQFAAGDPMPPGTFVGHQQFAFYTSFCAAMAFALVVSEKQKVRRQAYIVVFAVLLFGSLLGQERAPWLSFFVAGLVVAACSGKARKRLLLRFGIVALAAIILVFSIPQLRDITISRFAEAQNDTEQSNSLLSRLALWGVAYQFFLEHPILGVGPKNFQTLVPHYLSVEEMMGGETMDPHNAWIGILAEQGIIGFATYLLFSIAIIRLATRPLRQDLPPQVRSLCLAFLAYHAFWFTMAYHYFYKGTGHMHFMLIGLMLGLRGSFSIEPSHNEQPRLSPVSSIH